MGRARVGLLVGSTIAVLAFVRDAEAATVTWAGASAGTWSDASSWLGAVAPVSGDDLVFPAGPTGLTVTNDFPVGTSFGSITVTGDGYVLDGNAVDLAGDIVVTSTTTGPTFGLPIALTNSISVSVAGPSTVKTTFLDAASIDLGPHTLSVSGDGTTEWHGKILGPGGFARVSGTGEAVFFADNNYLGPTTVAAGILLIRSEKALGGKGTGTTVSGTGQLRLLGTGAMTVEEPIVLASSAFASLSSLSQTGTTTWAGPIVLDADSQATGGAAPVTISGSISGAHTLKVSSNGGFTLSGANTHTGGTTVASNGITFTQPSALGTGLVYTWLGAWVTVANGTYTNAIKLSGSTYPRGGLRTLAGSTTWSGPIDLFSPDSSIETAGSLLVSGGMSGVGGLIKRGAGELTIASTSTYGGGTTILQGVLHDTVAQGIPDASPIEVTGTFILDAGLSETIGSLGGDGSVVLGDGSVVTTGGNGQTTAFSGGISGNGAVVFVGTGTKYLHGASTYTGTTSVNGGTVSVHGSIVSPSVVATGARLGLANGGSAGSITATGGTVAPGYLANASRSAQSGALVLGATSTFDVQLYGTGADAWSRLAVAGPTSLGGATLTIGLGFTPAIGDAFPIIVNDGADAVIGTFGGLAEGGVIAVSGSFFRVSYMGGDGNDVVLTKVIAPPPDAGAVVDGGTGTDAGPIGQEDSGVADGGVVDAGVGGGADSGAAGATGADAGTSTSDVAGSGCDCRESGPAEAPRGPIVLSAALAILALARRRAKRSSV